jgi:hypothetical protein
MSRPDLLAELREARPVAPEDLRERVRLIAVATTAPPRRRVTWRRAAAVLVPVAAAVAVAAVTLLPAGQKTASPKAPVILSGGIDHAAAAGAPERALPAKGFGYSATQLPAPSSTRLQRYATSLDLQVASPGAVSAATKRAVAIAAALGGYEQSVVVHTAAKGGYADLVLRVPAANVRAAVGRLSALGRITAENVAIQDLTVQVNATDATIARLQRQLAALRTQQQTTQVAQQIAAVTAHVQRLQRERAATVREAHYATVALGLATPPAPAPVHHRPGPLHGLGIAFHWLWIGAVYLLALGAPLVLLGAGIWLLARTIRSRREARLLER